MTLQLEVLVSVEPEEPAEISNIADQLAAAGLNVQNVHDAISVITGVCDESSVRSLSQVPGVLDVERQRTFRIAPPDSDVQ